MLNRQLWRKAAVNYIIDHYEAPDSAAQIGSDFTPKVDGVWASQYHHKLYNLTDSAIRGPLAHRVYLRPLLLFCIGRADTFSANLLAACPKDTEWVVVTNGDNDYSRSFFDRIGSVTNADVIAFDFYTRYHRSTGELIPSFPSASSNCNLEGQSLYSHATSA